MNLMVPPTMTITAPRALLTFEDRFQTEEDCRQYLEECRWPDGFRCACGSRKAWRTERGFWKCMSCRATTSVTAGTIFHGSHLPLLLWFRALWWMTNHRTGISALGLQHTLNLGSYRTAWSMLHAIRTLMTIRRRPLRRRIDVGIRCFCAGGWQCAPSARHSWVAIAVEERREGVGRIRMRRLQARTPDELDAFLHAVVAPKSTVYADDPETAKLLKACKYEGVAPKPLIARSGSRIQLTAGLAKRWIVGTHQGRIEHRYLQEYLEEFSFRFNRRNNPHPGALFDQLLSIAVFEHARPRA